MSETIYQKTLRHLEQEGWGEECGFVEDLQARNQQLEAALLEAKSALQWCGGSHDFSPEGQARLGWERIVLPALASISALNLGEKEK